MIFSLVQKQIRFADLDFGLEVFLELPRPGQLQRQGDDLFVLASDFLFGSYSLHWGNPSKGPYVLLSAPLGKLLLNISHEAATWMYDQLLSHAGPPELPRPELGGFRKK